MDNQSSKYNLLSVSIQPYPSFLLDLNFFSETGWDRTDASVICRMLGFNPGPGTSVALVRSSFGYLDIPNYNRTAVGCTGTEQSIYDCPSYSPSYWTSSGGFGAGVMCNYIPPSNTTIELVGGNSTKEGNVLLNGSPIW